MRFEEDQEEAAETLLAAKDGDKLHIVRETADLWFPLCDVELSWPRPDDVLAELRRREGISESRRKQPGTDPDTHARRELYFLPDCAGRDPLAKLLRTTGPGFRDINPLAPVHFLHSEGAHRIDDGPAGRQRTCSGRIMLLAPKLARSRVQDGSG
jgi:hypothetical protein